MKATDIMTGNPISVELTASIMTAARLMLQHRIGGLPVVAGSGTLAGIITEADLLSPPETGKPRASRARWIEFLIGPGPLAPDHAQACKRKVYEAISPEVLTISEDATVEEIARIMELRGIKRLPVLRGGKLVGIVCRSDLIRALFRMTRAGGKESGSRTATTLSKRSQPSLGGNHDHA